MSLTASPSTVLSEGYGVWGSIYLLPTLGFGIPAAVTQTAFWRPYMSESSDVLVSACESVDVTMGGFDDQYQ